MEIKLINKQARRLLVLFLSVLFLNIIGGMVFTNGLVSAEEIEMVNYPPLYDTYAPPTGSTNLPLAFEFSIVILDPNGDLFDYFVSCTNGQVKSGFQETNGTKTLFLNGLDFDTTYYIWVNATDHLNSSNMRFKYSTRPAFLPEKPTSFDSLTSTETQIDLSWVPGENADKTYIEWNVVPGWKRGQGTMIYNGSGTSYSHTNLIAHRRYFYQAWSWNETDKVYSKEYVSVDAYRFGYIPENGTASPIRKYFTIPKILWTFDDYMISANYHPPHLGFTVIPEVVIGYGGYVNIMTILFGRYETHEYRNYSVIDELDWSEDRIKKSLEFFSQDHISPAGHGWDYQADPLNTATLEEAYTYINYTMWNWYNNFGIKPRFFLGGSTSGNYNVTLALKKFSEKYWTVYGEDFRWQEPDKFPETSRDAPAVEYITKYEYCELFDPLFGVDWGVPCETLDDAIALYNEETKNKELIFIRGHPKYFDDTDPSSVENISLWKSWIDWIYQNHELININHTQAIEYNVDRYNFVVYKNSVRNFSIDLRGCKYDHDIIFSQPYSKMKTTWEVYDDGGMFVGDVFDDATYSLKAGTLYYFVSDDEALDELENDTDDTPGFTFGFLILSLLSVCIILLKRKR
jgi:hypothetical protein